MNSSVGLTYGGGEWQRLHHVQFQAHAIRDLLIAACLSSRSLPLVVATADVVVLPKLMLCHLQQLLQVTRGVDATKGCVAFARECSKPHEIAHQASGMPAHQVTVPERSHAGPCIAAHEVRQPPILRSTHATSPP